MWNDNADNDTLGTVKLAGSVITVTDCQVHLGYKSQGKRDTKYC